MYGFARGFKTFCNYICSSTVDDRFSDDLFSDNDGFSDQNSDDRIAIYVVNTSDLVINIQFSEIIGRRLL